MNDKTSPSPSQSGSNWGVLEGILISQISQFQMADIPISQIQRTNIPHCLWPICQYPEFLMYIPVSERQYPNIPEKIAKFLFDSLSSSVCGRNSCVAIYCEWYQCSGSFEVAFLLEKSVYQWIWGYTSRPYVNVGDSEAPWKIDRLKLCFFWERV